MIDSPVKVPRELNRKRRVRWYEGYLKIRFFCFSRKVTYGILVYGTQNLTVKGHVETTCAGNARVSAISAGPNISLANKRLFRARSGGHDTQL